MRGGRDRYKIREGRRGSCPYNHMNRLRRQTLMQARENMGEWDLGGGLNLRGRDTPKAFFSSYLPKPLSEGGSGIGSWQRRMEMDFL